MDEIKVDIGLMILNYTDKIGNYAAACCTESLIPDF